MSDFARTDIAAGDPSVELDFRGSYPSMWYPLKAADGHRSASLICPNGHEGVLLDHDIAEDGRVSPSVVCPWEGCGFHEHVRLVGWSDVSQGDDG